MKKLYTSAIVIVLSCFLLSSCLEDDDCKICKQNEYVNNSFTRELNSIEACGDEVTDYETLEPVTIGNTTTKYDCE